MSLVTLAKRNALDPYRSGSLWVLLGLFVVVFAFVGYFLADVPQSPTLLFVQILVLLGPLAALAFGYQSIADPRQSGGLRVLLSYPYTRREVVLGTLVGRVAVISLAVTVAVVTGVVTTMLFGGSMAAGPVAIALGFSLLLSIAIVGVAVGISASVATSTRAAVLAFGAYLLFSGFWGLVPSLGQYVLNGFSFSTGPTPEWVFVWNQLNPFNAFRTAVQALLDAPLSEAFYHAPWFGVLVIVAWFVLPVLVGLLRFERADL